MGKHDRFAKHARIRRANEKLAEQWKRREERKQAQRLKLLQATVVKEEGGKAG